MHKEYPTNPEECYSYYYNERLGIMGMTLAMAFIPGGTFLMGSPEDEEKRFYSETQHEVTIEPFFMGQYLITQEQWCFVTSLPQIKTELATCTSHNHGLDNPVENMTWEQAVEFCARLSQYTGKKYQLPTEAQWEYACRARTTTAFNFGETFTKGSANIDNHFPSTTKVGIFPPNAFGLYDMHGNVWEWCQDTWHSNYNGAPRDGSAWMKTGHGSNWRVIRGGSWNSPAEHCRSANRDFAQEDRQFFDAGFRVVCEADIPSPG
jgi:formylglycine-generating enzyme required for sulfatase activity